jgi:hypothetical protein
MLTPPLNVSPAPARERGPGGEVVSRRGRRGTRVTAGALLGALVACAKMGAPPGGPPDLVPPSIVGTRPDSVGVYPDFKGNVEFIFDETVSEGSSPDFGNGNGDLERLVVLSPTAQVPRVSWERSRITVRPREGWRPNTVYRVELLPGITDLRHNRERRGTVITFSTGAPLPTDSVSGIAIDWTTRQPARQAVIQALLLPDSLPYLSQSDSSGRFVLAPLPHGRYLLSGFLDQNRNRRIDGRENWDTLGIAPAPAATGVLWLAPRDTVGPKVMAVSIRDSLLVEIQLSQPLDPAQVFDTANIVLRSLPDSSVIPVRALRTKLLDDSLVARARALADSIRADSVRRAHPDTGAHAVAPPARPVTPNPLPPVQLSGRGRREAKPPAPVDSTVLKLAQTRPPLGDRLMLRLLAPLRPEAKYSVEVRGIRNVNGVATATAMSGFAVPKARAVPDSTRRDSTRTAPVGTPRDST